MRIEASAASADAIECAASTRGRSARWNPFIGFVVLFGACLIWLSFARAILVAINWQRLQSETALWRLFAIGLRMDIIVVCQLFAAPIGAFFLLPGNILRRRLTVGLLAFAGLVLVFMELSTPSFMAEYDRRPDRIFFEYLSHPREVFATLLQAYGWQLFVVVALSACATFWFGRLSHALLRANRSWQKSWPKRALLFPMMAVLLFVGARSSFGHRPANASTAAFSDNRVTNELAMNSAYSLFSAIYMMKHEADAAHLYASMELSEAVNRVRSYMDADSSFTNPQIPTLHRTALASRASRRPNVVIFVLESVGAEFVGGLGGLPLTPNLDRLSAAGAWFTDFYATGTRTVRGLEAIATGFPPTAAQSVLKLPAAQHDFFTLADLLRRQGYATEFVYGGVANFDNMGKFFRDNGFQHVVEQKDFDHATLLGSWGVSDEDLVTKAHERFMAYEDRSFFALMLSTSNHVPFEYPQGRIDLHEQPAATRNNAVKYTDYAVGKFFELARRAQYFRHTIFVVVADHGARVYGADLVPVERFRIPCLIMGPGVPNGQYSRVASQIDLGPTVISLLGIDAEHPMIGRNLFLSSERPGRAIMQYGEVNAFRFGDKVVIHRPHMPPATFFYKDNRLVAAPADAELQRDALAHLIWADASYRSRLYRGSLR